MFYHFSYLFTERRKIIFIRLKVNYCMTKRQQRFIRKERDKERNQRESDQLTSEMLQSFRHIHEEKILVVAHPLSWDTALDEP
jgi:hypothetical protein